MATAPNTASALPLPKLVRVLLAVVVFACASWLIYFLSSLPTALPIEERSWGAAHNEELVLSGLAPGPLLSFVGQAGQGLDVRATGHFDSATLTTLAQFPPSPPPGDVPVIWSAGSGGSGKVVIAIAMQPTGNDAEIAFAATGANNVPELRLRPQHAELRILFQVASPSTPQGTSSSMGLLHVIAGDVAIAPPAAMNPLVLIVPAGQSATLRFPSVESLTGALLNVGTAAAAGEAARSLPVLRASVRRTSGSDALSVCGAADGTMLFKSMPTNRNCSSRGQLDVSRLTITPDQVSVDLSGSGFIMRDGKSASAGMLATIEKNPVAAILLGFVYLSLARWVWTSVTGKKAP